MTVYVDDMFKPAKVRNGNRFVSDEWCHMQDVITMRNAWLDKLINRSK